MPSQPSLQFVVLHHTGVDHPHFDLLFETAPGSELFGIRLDQWPITAETKHEISSIHRRHYLTFEGEISGQRGRVSRVAAGTCEVEPSADSMQIKFDVGEGVQLLQLSAISSCARAIK